MYGGPGDEYRVPEYVRTYPRGMEYSTRVLEDMEPRAEVGLLDVRRRSVL